MRDKYRVILASASPRRQELLTQLGVKHRVMAVDIEESCKPAESPEECVKRLALEKARKAKAKSSDALVIGSDTMVVVNGRILGKPMNRADGLQMLESLSGRQHEVLTAVAVAGHGREISCVQHSQVQFRELSSAEIAAYWQTGEPADKAGAYAIQGLAAQFIQRLEGSYSGVMGLPLYETASLLGEFGVNPLELSDARRDSD